MLKNNQDHDQVGIQETVNLSKRWHHNNCFEVIRKGFRPSCNSARVKLLLNDQAGIKGFRVHSSECRNIILCRKFWHGARIPCRKFWLEMSIRLADVWTLSPVTCIKEERVNCRLSYLYLETCVNDSNFLDQNF